MAENIPNDNANVQNNKNKKIKISDNIYIKDSIDTNVNYFTEEIPGLGLKVENKTDKPDSDIIEGCYYLSDSISRSDNELKNNFVYYNKNINTPDNINDVNNKCIITDNNIQDLFLKCKRYDLLCYENEITNVHEKIIGKLFLNEDNINSLKSPINDKKFYQLGNTLSFIYYQSLINEKKQIINKLNNTIEESKSKKILKINDLNLYYDGLKKLEYIEFKIDSIKNIFRIYFDITKFSIKRSKNIFFIYKIDQGQTYNETEFNRDIHNKLSKIDNLKIKWNDDATELSYIRNENSITYKDIFRIKYLPIYTNKNEIKTEELIKDYILKFSYKDKKLEELVKIYKDLFKIRNIYIYPLYDIKNSENYNVKKLVSYISNEISEDALYLKSVNLFNIKSLNDYEIQLQLPKNKKDILLDYKILIIDENEDNKFDLIKDYYNNNTNKNIRDNFIKNLYNILKHVYEHDLNKPNFTYPVNVDYPKDGIKGKYVDEDNITEYSPWYIIFEYNNNNDKSTKITYHFKVKNSIKKPK